MHSVYSTQSDKSGGALLNARLPAAISCRICGKNAPHPAIDLAIFGLIGVGGRTLKTEPQPAECACISAL